MSELASYVSGTCYQCFLSIFNYTQFLVFFYWLPNTGWGVCIEFSDFRTTLFCTSYFIFFFWKNFTLPKESLFPDQSEDPWFRLTGNVHGWFCCCLVSWFLPLLCPWTWKYMVTLPQNMIRATFLSIPHVTCLLRHLVCSHRINLVKISLATYYALSGELYSVFRILVM